MDELITFEHQQLGELRGLLIDEEPWFIAADICKFLDLPQVTNALSRLDDDEKALISIKGISRGNNSVNIVSEAGFYKLVTGSRKDKDPRVKAFKRWVTHDVLPSIRKHGAYIAGQEEMSREQLLAKAYLAAMEINKEKDAKIAVLQDQNINLRIINEENKPKVLFADTVTSSDSTINVGTLAKMMQQEGLDVGRDRLFGWLKRDGFIMKKGHPLPTQRAMEMGLFEIAEKDVPLPTGKTILRQTAKVTAKGQIYFINRYVGKKKQEENEFFCWPEV